MDNKQAKEILKTWKDKGSDGLINERLGYIERWYHKKDDIAFNIAIKSLEAWDKVIKEIEDDEQLAFMYGSIDMYTGIKESREIIEKYKKEIEE